MANHVSTTLTVESENPKVFKQLQKWFLDKPYKELSDTLFLYHTLYGDHPVEDWGRYIDRMGAKWVYIEEEESDGDYFRMNILSAWYFPKEAIERLGELLSGIDPDVLLKFTFEDEGLNPIGGGAWHRHAIDYEEEEYEQPDEDELSPEAYEAAREVMYEEVYHICETIMNACTKFLLEEYTPSN